MAVIKIVPMPGAVGDKGDEGAPGAQGPQGPAGQNGLPGTPALWSYQGAYNSAAAYAVGDVVVYQGQLYYTKSVTTAGTLPTNATKFDLIASKGADGTNGTNGTNGADGAPGSGFGIYYLGNYNPSSGYVPDIAVVRGSDGQLYLAKASGQLGDPVGNTAQWEVWIPKGQDGAPGTNGADALWNYVGEYGGGNSYAVGDVVTYDGQLWYRYNSNGGNVGDTPSPGLWNLLAAKGSDGTELNFWNFAGDPGVPTVDGALVTDGLSARSGGNVTIHATTGGKVVVAGDGGEFLFDSNVPANQIATIGNINDTVSNGMVRYSPTFEATGLTFTGSDGTHPTYNSYYVKAGKMVTFAIEVDCATVTNFGTGQYKLQLPFTPAIGFNHFSGWAHVDTAVNPDITNGHIILNVDHAGVTDVLDLHYLKQAGGANSGIIEGIFLQGTPVTLTTSSKIYVNGTYIAQ